MKTKSSPLVDKIFIESHDSPSVKNNNVVFMVPDLEVIIYPNRKELEEAWYAEEPNFNLTGTGDFWGFYDITQSPSVRIHTRSVRSHPNKDEFFHTLGHELAHIMQHMEEFKPAGSYKQACIGRIKQDVKALCLLTWIEAYETHKENWFGKILCQVERTVARIHTRLRQK